MADRVGWRGSKESKQCSLGEVENEEHLALRCKCYLEERKIMVGYMGELVDGWQKADDWFKKIALVMDLACTDDRISQAVKKIWILVQMKLDN